MKKFKSYVKLKAMNAALKLKKRAEIYYPETDGKPMAETDIHREQMNYLIETLKVHFQSRRDVYISGNIMFYYEEGNPRKVFSPDVMVCFGVSDEIRRTFKLWKEKQFPQVVFEISSRGTWGEDLNKKWFLYQQFGVKEYYIFDPEYDYLPEPLIAYRAKRGELKQVAVKNKRIFSEELGLDVVDTGEGLRFFNPETKEFLLTLSEEQRARRQAEDEVARLREELQRLRNPKNNS
ncbi:MAG: Uma2 family endonuclease [Acidobacteriota bacterium]|nr:Uma2 family endonuclease [Acidobacteriota bacterium]